MTTQQFPGHLSAIDAALTAPGGTGRLLRLHVSQEFWDADPADARAAAEEFEAEREALDGVLSLRWGPPGVLDLTPHLERSAMGLPEWPPLAGLSALTTTAHAWTVGECRVATGVGRAAEHLPYELVAAVWPDGGGGPPLPRQAGQSSANAAARSRPYSSARVVGFQ
ncbi:hypothetical protein C3486_26795 [Streptomyces sp. Ru73]|uniref:hypothetical protein n=1 Tax=Streptomyces sp. Ru73 TaxID=2080748 RepID=UPI000CDE55BA|nr:hypothetical protein [Streptomyces sp. Ru73]POX37769.1 hypothetical protein C3486_26795 [Streptomyces sp. Ru73]